MRCEYRCCLWRAGRLRCRCRCNSCRQTQLDRCCRCCLRKEYCHFGPAPTTTCWHSGQSRASRYAYLPGRVGESLGKLGAFVKVDAGLGIDSLDEEGHFLRLDDVLDVFLIRACVHLICRFLSNDASKTLEQHSRTCMFIFVCAYVCVCSVSHFCWAHFTFTCKAPIYTC